MCGKTPVTVPVRDFYGELPPEKSRVHDNASEDDIQFLISRPAFKNLKENLIEFNRQIAGPIKSLELKEADNLEPGHAPKSFDRDRPIHLKNLGNTCYENSIKQCLFSLNMFMDDFDRSTKEMRSYVIKPEVQSFGNRKEQEEAQQDVAKDTATKTKSDVRYRIDRLPNPHRTTTCKAAVQIVPLLFLLCVQHLMKTECRRTISTEDEFSGEPNSDVMLMDGAGEVQCEPIAIPLCANMAYQSTRMPNFFGDSNQIEALSRAHLFQRLAMSKCSPHVHAYVCELLAPVCLEHSQEAMKRFEIYPCRSFCRRVQLDCELELSRLDERLLSQGSQGLLPGFACDKLPFESNGGNGSLSGPCHQMPEQQQQQQQQSNKSSYRPYQPALDANVPPFITDTSRIDPNLIKPISEVFEEPPAEDLQGPSAPIQEGKQKPDSNGNQPSGDIATTPDRVKPQTSVSVLGYLSSVGRSFAITLIKYSNALSIMSALILIIALFSKRLRRLKCRLSPSSSTKSSSSNSTSSHHPLQPNQSKLNQFPIGCQLVASADQHGRHHQVSPSASSRSLMLIAGTNKQPASHQLVDTSPSQKLLYGMQTQRTLINVNGTLDRQLSNRYHQLVLQSAGYKQQPAKAFISDGDKRQLFNTLDSQSSSNQYDYIMTPGEQAVVQRAELARQQQQQQQQQNRLYSNILLSSPSHQVLLFDEPQQQQVANQSRSLLQRNPQQLPPRQPLSRQMASASDLSPYDSPSSFAGSCPAGQVDTRQQRSFQRRASAKTADAQLRPPVPFGSPTRGAYAVSSASSCSSSNSNSNSNSSYSALSPASSTNVPQTPLVQTPARSSSSRRPL